MKRAEIEQLVTAALSVDTEMTVKFMSQHVYGLITKEELLFKIADMLWGLDKNGNPSSRVPVVLMARAFEEYSLFNQRVRCGHPRWGTTVHCANMNCSNYVARYDWLSHHQGV